MGQNKKVKMGKGKNETEPVARDRISELPDSIFHQILSLVPTIHAVRTSLVSKRWLHMCLTLPSLSFCDSDFDRDISSESQCNIISNCFRLREADMVAPGNAPVTRVKLESGSYDHFNVDDWLGLIAQSKVKDLDLSVWWMDEFYFLPEDILSMTSLTRLRLCWVEFEDELPPISLPNLTFLFLENVKLSDKTIDELLLGCPSLEKFFIESCHGLTIPRVSSTSLRSLDFRTHTRKPLWVEAPNLESIVVHGFDVHSRSDLRSCRTVTVLTFAFVERGDHRLEELISRLHCLESLNLHCGGLEYVEINSQTLRSLTLCIHRSDKSEVIIKAPKLAYFSFIGNPGVDISMEVPDLLEVNVKLYRYGKHDSNWYKDNVTWFTNLIYFLSKLDRYSKTLVLHVFSEEALIIPDRLLEICKAPFVTMKHLTVRTREPLFRSSELKSSLLWMIPSQETVPIEQDEDLICLCFMMY